jgi:endonuclease/exonuclease/phosphatase family metal-dependent hydrolase
VYDERNLVVATTFPILNVEQLRNDLVDPLSYRRLTANPPDAGAVTISIERPILHVHLDLPNGTRLHVINVHLKSKIPTDIPGQKIDNYTWRSADAWAEGSFLSSMKRMSQALEVRRLVDQILDADPNAQIVGAGDFNAAPDEVPVMAIRGDVENTGNADLVGRVLVPIEHTIPAPARYTLYHQGRGEMLDHMLISRNLLAHYRGSEIHNEILHDESAAFAIDRNILSPTTPQSSQPSTSKARRAHPPIAPRRAMTAYSSGSRTKINSPDPPLPAVRTAYLTPPFPPLFHPPIEPAGLGPRGHIHQYRGVDFPAIWGGKLLQICVIEVHI